MDDVVVIILTLIIAVFGALGQIKKKKAGQLVEKTSTPQPDNFWNLFNEQQGYSSRKEEDFFEPGMVREEIIEEPKVAESPSTKYEFTAENEGKSMFADDLTKKQNQYNPRINKLWKDFSLKKAVIYSEILNRKYN